MDFLEGNNEPKIYETNFQGHKGMIHVAQYVLRTMEQESVLAEAFETYPEYKLVVTGI